MIVTVGGLPGTGTSTLCRLLERELGLPYVYAGQIFRQEAAARGLTLAELNELAGSDSTVDRQLDERQLELLKKGNVILEGRMSGWLAHTNGIDALTVWVTCDAEERIRRLVDRDGGDPEEQRRATDKRVEQEQDRYRRFYGAEVDDQTIYDLVLDSTSTPPAELVRRVLEELGRESSVPESGPV
ncbi:MAG TPA: cytidylate kinase family protein [Actinomycetota bacterium]|nr:cytidylate kinase family protein [Actinomycetota bacterium]